MNRVRWYCVLLGFLALSGCSMRNGRFVTHTQHVFPNSNVAMLGPARAEMSKWGVFVGPTFTMKELQDVYRRALSQQAGANILVDYHEDTTLLWLLLPVYRVTYSLAGQAARMTVGEQALR